MATGDTLLVYTPLSNDAPSSNYALLGDRERHPYLAFDATATSIAVFPGVLPRQYDGGGLTCRIAWTPQSATSGNVIWALEVERHEENVTSLDVEDFAGIQDVIAGAGSSAGNVMYDEISFTSGAEMDSLAEGESFRLRLARHGASSSDTLTGNVQFIRLEVRET